MEYDIELRRVSEESLDDYALLFKGKVENGIVIPSDVVTILRIHDRDYLTQFLSDSLPLFKEAQGNPVKLTFGDTSLTFPYEMASQIFCTIEAWFDEYMDYVMFDEGL